MKKKAFAAIALGVTLSGVIIAACALCYQNRIKPLLATYAGARAVSETTAALNRAFVAALPDGVEYESLITVNRDKNGQVESLTADTAGINALRSAVITAATEELEELPPRETGIPLGSLLPFAFLYGKGPSLSFRSFPAGELRAEFSNTFTSAGINYTLHRIILTLTVKITVVMPGETLERDVSAEFYIAETVLSGGIPDIYINGG